MRRRLEWCVVGAVVAVTLATASSPRADTAYTNPVIPGDFPDPTLPRPRADGRPAARRHRSRAVLGLAHAAVPGLQADGRGGAAARGWAVGGRHAGDRASGGGPAPHATVGTRRHREPVPGGAGGPV